MHFAINKHFVASSHTVYMVGFFQVLFPLVLLYSPSVLRYFLLNLLSCTPEPFSVCYSFYFLLPLHVISLFFYLHISPISFFLLALISLAILQEGPITFVLLFHVQLSYFCFYFVCFKRPTISLLLPHSFSLFSLAGHWSMELSVRFGRTKMSKRKMGTGVCG